jgi:hypothetical protein
VKPLTTWIHNCSPDTKRKLMRKIHDVHEIRSKAGLRQFAGKCVLKQEINSHVQLLEQESPLARDSPLRYYRLRSSCHISFHGKKQCGDDQGLALCLPFPSSNATVINENFGLEYRNGLTMLKNYDDNRSMGGPPIKSWIGDVRACLAQTSGS